MVGFNYANSAAKGGAAADLACTNCVVSSEITDGTIVDADIAAGAAIAPSKVSGTAWTSTNDGTASGLDADLLDGNQMAAMLVPSFHSIPITPTCAGGSKTYGNKFGWIYVDHTLKNGNDICAHYGLKCTEVIRCVSCSTPPEVCDSWWTGQSCTSIPDPGRYWPSGTNYCNGDRFACCQ
jgi:hypothetical protein